MNEAGQYSAEELSALLIKAAGRNDAALCEQLLRDGVDVNAEYELMVPLHAAAKAGAARAVGVLLAAGANVHYCLGERHGKPGAQALDLAVSGGHAEVCKLLIMAGADALRPRSFVGSPLHVAIMDGDFRVVQAMLDLGASSSAQVPDAPDGLTPFQLAVQTRKLDIIADIVRRGSEDLAQRTAGGKTLLQLARSDRSTIALLRSLRVELDVGRASGESEVQPKECRLGSRDAPAL